MFSYCFKCRKNTKTMLLSKCAMCNSKKSKFINEPKARGFLSNLTGIEVPIVSVYI